MPATPEGNIGKKFLQHLKNYGHYLYESLSLPPEGKLDRGWVPTHTIGKGKGAGLLSWTIAAGPHYSLVFARGLCRVGGYRYASGREWRSPNLPPFFSLVNPFFL